MSDWPAVTDNDAVNEALGYAAYTLRDYMPDGNGGQCSIDAVRSPDEWEQVTLASLPAAWTLADAVAEWSNDLNGGPTVGLGELPNPNGVNVFVVLAASGTWWNGVVLDTVGAPPDATWNETGGVAVIDFQDHSTTPEPPPPRQPSSIEHLLSREATLLVRTYDGNPDDYGNPTWSDSEQRPTRCELQQAGSREELGDAVQVATHRVWLPPDAPARGWDGLLVDNVVYELVGDAAIWRNPRTGVDHHVEAYVVMVE